MDSRKKVLLLSCQIAMLSKCLLNIYAYTHRHGLLSKVREAFICSQEQLMEIWLTDQRTEDKRPSNKPLMEYLCKSHYYKDSGKVEGEAERM